MELKFRFVMVAILILLLSKFNYSQTPHHHHHHHDSDYEIGLSVGLTHLVHENENPLGAHIHLLRKLGSENILERFSLGVGFEYLFSDPEHYSAVGTLSINPIWALIFDISPGILITEHEGEQEKLFVTHFELTYEFHYKDIGIGPVIGMGISDEDNHYMIGMHIGKGF